MNLRGAFDVPRDYRALLAFASGVGGWFVDPEIRRQAHLAIQEIVMLRTFRDNPPRTPNPPPPADPRKTVRPEIG